MNDQDCVFCKIANKEIPSNIVYEDEFALAFHDLDPKAPTHILLIPKKHIKSIDDLNAEDEMLVGHLILLVQKLAKQFGFTEDGYRVVINTGNDGGQTVHHLHVHLLGGRRMAWPPG